MALLKMYGLKKEDILNQVKSEFNQSRNVVQNKRQVFRDRLKLYNEQTKDKSKITANLCFANLQFLMALSCNDDLSVQFVGREFSDSSQANIIGKVAEFDKEEMNLDTVNYAMRWWKYFSGVGIRVFDSWNPIRKCPNIYVPDTMVWLPDPKGWLCADDFRRHGFQTQMTKEEMKELGFQNLDSFKKRGDSEFYLWNPYNRLGVNQEQNFNEDMNNYYVYNHYCIIKGDRYLVSTNYEMSEIGRLIPIEEILQDEDNGAMWPITLSYYRPEPFNPHGTSLMDLSEDKQRILSKLLNLGVSRAIRSSLGGTRIYNKDKIPNAADLSNLTEDPKLIGITINPGESINDVLVEQQMSQVPQDNFSMSDMVQYWNRLATGIDPLTMGISTPGGMTATEAQQIQANANLVLSYGNFIDFIGEKDFWKKWYKELKKNLTGNKVVRIINGMGTKIININKTDVKTKEDPDIVLKSKNEEKAKNKEKANMIAALVGTLPEGYGKIYGMRKVFELNGIDEDEARVFVGETPEEIEATKQLLLLNKNQKLEKVEDIMQDHDAYLAIYKQAIDTPAKALAIQDRLLAKMAKQKAQKALLAQQPNPGEQPGNANANTANNMIMSNSLQQKKEVATTGDVQSK